MPKPDCGATVRTKKSIRVPCIVTSARVLFGQDGAVEGGSCQRGHARCVRMISERRAPMITRDKGDEEIAEADGAVVGCVAEGSAYPTHVAKGAP